MKVDKYFDAEKTLSFGDFEISVTDKTEYASYIVRVIKVSYFSTITVVFYWTIPFILN